MSDLADELPAVEISDPPTTGVEPDSAPPSERRFRGDIDGLRAVAIVLVVGYHALIPGFHGGFVGVDVFFVISGFLITRNLLSESTRTGRVALMTFWAKRIRRLVPALALMVVAVVALSLFILPSLDWPSVADQARAALLYVSNLVFARQATDYFGGDISTSLFLHTWSLGVEEQFYLLWPLLVGGACLLVRGRDRRLLRPILIVGFGVTFVVSLSLCVYLTSTGSAFAFFGLPARAWEFAAAGLLAAVPLPAVVRTRGAQIASAVVGVALLLTALVLLSDSSVYPGFWPLLPVSATVLIIISGDIAVGMPGNPLSQVLSLRPMRALGRVSYSWYLWHWPFILLAIAYFDKDKRSLRLAAVLVALGVATVAYTLVENRVRFAKALTGSIRLTYVVGLGVTFGLVLGTFGLQRFADNRVDNVVKGVGAGGQKVSLAEVRGSRKQNECLDPTTSPSGIPYCEDGDLSSDRMIMLIGDSHAGHWRPVFDKVATEQHIHVVVRWAPSCPAVPVLTKGKGMDIPDPKCQAFRDDTATLVTELKPDAVVVSNSNEYKGSIIPGQAIAPDGTNVEIWAAGYRELMTSLQAEGVKVAGIVDTPLQAQDPIDCLASKDAADCATSKTDAFVGQKSFMQAEADVRKDLGIKSLDINGTLCPDTTCPVVIDGIYVYADPAHLYSGFVVTRSDQVTGFLNSLLN